jgi:hypothetical protein
MDKSIVYSHFYPIYRVNFSEITYLDLGKLLFCRFSANLLSLSGVLIRSPIVNIVKWRDFFKTLIKENNG